MRFIHSILCAFGIHDMRHIPGTDVWKCNYCKRFFTDTEIREG